MTAIEQLQETLSGLGLAAIEARLEGLLEQASKTIELVSYICRMQKTRTTRDG
jgi:hypothetical protein